LERQRHVESAASGILKGRYGLGEGAGLDTDGLVVERLTGLRGKCAVNERGLAVSDGMAHDRVAVHGLERCRVDVG
jgi:hypothetical protein